jgi:Zinc-binding dehydrogenase
VGRALRRAVAAAASGTLRVHVESLPLAQATEAHRRIESGTTTGKLVFEVEPRNHSCPDQQRAWSLLCGGRSGSAGRGEQGECGLACVFARAGGVVVVGHDGGALDEDE